MNTGNLQITSEGPAKSQTDPQLRSSWSPSNTTPSSGFSHVFLQLPQQKHHITAATSAPPIAADQTVHQTKHFLHLVLLSGEARMQARTTVGFTTATLTSPFLPPPAHPASVILFPFPRSCIAATATEQNQQGLLYTGAGMNTHRGGKQHKAQK